MASIKKTSQGTWRVRYRDPAGKAKGKTFKRKVDANDFAIKVEHDKRTGSYIDQSAGRVTYQSFAEEWRKTRVHRDGTARRVDSYLRNHIYPRIGARPIGAIRPSEIQALVKASSQILAPATVEGVYKTVKAVFRSAVTDRVIAVSPCVDVALPRKPRKRVVPLTTDQVLSIAEFVPGRYRGLIVFMAGTGLRPSEAFGVTVDRVEFLRHQVTVDRQLSGTAPTFGQPKTEASYRDVPLPDIVLEGLSAHISAHGLGAEGLLFTNTKGQPIDRRRFGEIWRRAAKKVQVASTPHDARHYYASLLIRYGESVKTVQARLGHSTAGETLNTYGHLWPDSDDRTRAAVDEMLGVGASISRQSLGVSDVEAGQGRG